VEYSQYSQYCNNVKLHAVQRSSTMFLTIAHFNNKCYTLIHKSLQNSSSINQFLWHVRESGTLLKCTATYVWWTELKKLVIVNLTLIDLLMTILTQSDYGTQAFADFCELKSVTFIIEMCSSQEPRWSELYCMQLNIFTILRWDYWVSSNILITVAIECGSLERIQTFLNFKLISLNFTTMMHEY